MKETVVAKPPTFVAIQWDGTNQEEFTSTISGVTAIVSGDNLVLFNSANQMATVQSGQWAVVPSTNLTLPAISLLSEADFQAQYVAQQ